MDNQSNARQEVEARIVAKAWKDESFKDRLLSDPKSVLEEEVGAQLPDIDVYAHEESLHTMHLVVPVNPTTLVDQELSEDQLEAVAGGAQEAIGLEGTLSVYYIIVSWDCLPC